VAKILNVVQKDFYKTIRRAYSSRFVKGICKRILPANYNYFCQPWI